jgi:O-antigen/teichoic acid export membrane protein
MITKEQQIKNTFIYFLPITVGSIIPLVTLPIFTRILTKEDYGVWGLAQIYAVFMSGLANFGLTVGFERNFFQYKELKKSAQLLYSVMCFIISIFLVITVFTLLFKSYLSKWIIGSEKYGNILFWSFVATAIMGLKTYYLTYFKNTANAKAFVWYTIDETVMGAVLSLFMVAYLRIGIIGLIWGQLVASLIVFSLLAINFLKRYPFSFNAAVLKDVLKLSVPLTPRIFFGIIGNQFDKYMIGLMSTIGGVGIYTLGQKLAGIIFTFMTAIQNVFSPQVYKKMFELGDKGGESIGKYLTPFLYLSNAVALLISLFSHEIVVILMPQSYHAASEIIIILSMYYSIMFFGKQPQLLYSKKTMITSFLSISSIVLNVALNIPFILKWGMIGAAWGTFLSGLISGVISFVVSQKYYEIKWEYKKIGLIFLVFFSACISMIMSESFLFNYKAFFIVKIMFLILYVLLGFKLGIVTPANYSIIMNIVKGKKRYAAETA